MQVGVSLYLSDSHAHVEHTIDRATECGVTAAFTSLQIPEEQQGGARQRALHLMRRCREAGIELMADVSPRTLEWLAIPALAGLRDVGVSCVRLDYGFSDIETVELSRIFKVAFNASTTPVSRLRAWGHLGADLGRFVACHNYYPKPLTGLSLSYVKKINERFRALGVATMAFVPGDAVLRGPLHEGLPTIEGHRMQRERLQENVLELAQEGATDIVMVGDPGMSAASWKALGLLQRNLVSIRATFAEGFAFLEGSAHRDRIDSSDMVFRSVDSRATESMANRLLRAAHAQEGKGGQERAMGSVCLSLASYGRYAGELEVMRVDAPADERVVVIGQVDARDCGLLRYVREGMGMRFA